MDKKVKYLSLRMDFRFFIQKLKSKILELEMVLKEALNMLDQKDAHIETLEKENEELRILLEKTHRKEVPKNSRNSNRPPSTDIQRPKRTKERKKKSNKKPGGQPGHKGHYLEMSDSPDKTLHYYPHKCDRCNSILDRSLAKLHCSKQEIDLPPIQPLVTQFNRYQIACGCGKCNLGKLPERLTAKVQYGPRVRSIINYALVYQYVSFKRLAQMLDVCFGVQLSEGTIFNTMERTAIRMEKDYLKIKEFIGQSKVVGADETIIFVNGKKWYDWVWQNQKATFIACEPNRRKENITKHFPDGFKKSILISDRYSAHLNTPAMGYQICWSHLLRKLNFIDETEPNEWAKKLVNIYQRAKHLEILKTSQRKGSKKTKQLEADLTRLLIVNLDKKLFPETKTLFKSLKNNREKLLTFVYHREVPSHNNGSELAIRNAKIKMKISGCFRSAQQYYAVIRSMVDTMIKNGMPAFENLLKFEKGKAIKFSFA